MAETEQKPTPPEQNAPASAPPQAPQPQSGIDSDEKFFAALGYFGPLFVIPMLVKPKSTYCKFHARQSMVLFLITLIVLVVLAAVPLIGSLLTLAIFAVYVLAIYKSYMGESWKMPVVSKYAEKVNVDALYGKAGLAVGGIANLKEKAGEAAAKVGETMKDIGKQDDAPAGSNAADAKTTPPEQK